MTRGRTDAPAGGRAPAGDRRGCAAACSRPGSYSGATTAEIAREAGVSEPILYRHFGSKRDLYLACLDEAWAAAARGASTRRSRSRATAMPVPAIALGSREFHACERAAAEPLDAGADRGGRRTRRSRGLPAAAHARRARLHRRRHPARAGGRRRPGRPRRRRGGVGLHRRACSCSRSPTGSAACSDRTRLRRDRRRAHSAGSPAAASARPGTEPSGCVDEPREAKPTLQGSWRESWICTPQIPDSDCALKTETSPAAAPGTIREASCHLGDTPRDMTLRLDHGSYGCGGRLSVARPCTRAWRPAGASWPHCRSHVRKSQVARSSELL